MQWWQICLLICAVPITLVGIVVLGYLLFFLVRDFLLDLFGIDTFATIIHSTEYTGDGFHGGDPCYKGRYSFKDYKGKNHFSDFSGECYDVYDLVDYWAEARGIHAPGTRLHVRYVRWFPTMHDMRFPHPENESQMINWQNVPRLERQLDYQKASERTQKQSIVDWQRREEVWAVTKNQYHPPHISGGFARLRDEDIAVILLLGLERGFYSRDTIVFWADKEILERDKPEDWIIELSLSRNSHDEDVFALLQSIANVEQQTEEIGRRLLGILGECLQKEDCIPTYIVCMEAFELRFSAKLSEEEVAALGKLLTEFSQLSNPLQEVPDWLIRRLQLFLEPYERSRYNQTRE